MVKNTFGGNKHKGFARKLINAKSNNKLRVSEDAEEVYAIATKMLALQRLCCHTGPPTGTPCEPCRFYNSVCHTMHNDH